MHRELEFKLRGIRFSACAWGDEKAHPVLAVHGWLDNGASFARLGPLMSSCRVVAPDLAGHARSDDRPPQGGYNIWDDLPDLLALADALGWGRFTLLGHSRGAALASLLAAAAPQRVDALLLLDGFLPAAEKTENVLRQLAAFLKDAAEPPAASRRIPGFEQAVAHRVRKSGCSPEAARLLAERGLRRNADGSWQWRHDPRVMGASAMKLSEAQQQIVHEALRLPALGLLADGGLGARPEMRRLCEECSTVQWETLCGGHHFHLEEQAEEIAAKLEGFLRLQKLIQ